MGDAWYKGVVKGVAGRLGGRLGGRLWPQASQTAHHPGPPPGRSGFNRDGVEHHPKLVRAVGVGLGHESAARHTVRVVLELDGHVLHLGAALVDLRDAAHVPGVVGRGRTSARASGRPGGRAAAWCNGGARQHLDVATTCYLYDRVSA